jgi:hypothetical protein
MLPISTEDKLLILIEDSNLRNYFGNASAYFRACLFCAACKIVSTIVNLRIAAASVSERSF